MDANKIKSLLDLYYEGVTSPEEEKILYNYFRQNNIPEELQSEKEVFLKLYCLSENDFTEVPEGFEKKIDTLIDTLASKEKKKTTLWKKAAGIAASIVIILSVGVFLHQDKNERILADTYETPEEAYEETEKELLLVSLKLNKGFGQLEKAEKDMIRVNKILNEKIN